jgi:hypothetical protein
MNRLSCSGSSLLMYLKKGYWLGLMESIWDYMLCVTGGDSKLF